MIILKNPLEVADEVAQHFVSLSKVAIADHGKFNVALAGGTTPILAYNLLATKYSKDVDWNNVYIFWSDERFVPPDHQDSGIKPVKEALIDKISIPPENVFPFPTVNCTLEESAQIYSSTLKKHFDSDLPKFDLIMLGLGLDGHTASLFPNSQTSDSKELISIERNSPKPPPIRLTFTHKLINNAKNVIIIVTGKEKSLILEKILYGEKNIKNLPAQGVNPTNGKLEWIIDEAANSSK